jgi:hypothetical protein
MEPAVPGCSITGQSLSCALGDLTAGESVFIHVTSPTTRRSCGTYQNTAFAVADDFPQVQASASSTVVCQPATLIVEKQTLPDGDSTQFGFTGDATGTIGDGETIVVPNLAPGTYTAVESATNGWDLTRIVCDDVNSATPSRGDFGARRAIFGLDAGETVTCTFTNTKRGSIKIVKDVVPGTAATDFEFDPSDRLNDPFAVPNDHFLLDDDGNNFNSLSGEMVFSNLPAGGTYSVAEVNVATGWKVTGINCTGQTSGTTKTGAKVTIALVAGANVTCTFTNTRQPLKTGAKTIGFWQNKNGQNIIGSYGGANCQPLRAWLTQFNPFQDLTTATNCSGLKSYVTNVIKAANARGASMNAMLKAQMLGTALDVYFSDMALGGNRMGAPTPIGAVTIDLTLVCHMIDGSNGWATCSGSYKNVGAAFGGAASLTVSQMLTFAASQSNGGGSLWYGNIKSTQELAKDSFDAINNEVAFSL